MVASGMLLTLLGGDHCIGLIGGLVDAKFAVCLNHRFNYNHL